MFDKVITADEGQMLAKAGSSDYNVHMQYANEVAKAIETPLRKGQLPGDILGGIFQSMPVTNGNSTMEFPIDLLAPGTEREFVAYTIPNSGRIPDRHVEGDYVSVPTYPIGAGIGTNLRYIRDANWFVLGRMQEIMKNQFVKKMNDDGFHTILSAGASRNIVVYDADASAGQFTKRVVSLAKTVMRRNGGGNSGSSNRRKLTDLYVSPEALEDIRNWGVDQLDEVTRREIYVANDDSGAVNRVFGVNLHALDELGDNQEYQLYYENVLGGTMPSGDVEIGIGLDLSQSGFVMPVKQDVEIFNDPFAHRSQRFELYGWAECGFASLDNRSILLLSM